jgi:hypothetical protein
VAEIVEFPLDDGGVLLVQAVGGAADGPVGPDGELELLVPATGAGEAPPKPVQMARQSLETVVASVTPALSVVTRQLRRLSPDEVTVEFGLLLGAETGIIVSKGKGEVHFNVSLTWRKSGGPDGAGAAAEALAAEAATASGDDGSGGG